MDSIPDVATLRVEVDTDGTQIGQASMALTGEQFVLLVAALKGTILFDRRKRGDSDGDVSLDQALGLALRTFQGSLTQLTEQHASRQAALESAPAPPALQFFNPETSPPGDAPSGE